MKIAVEGIRVHGYHGVYEIEQQEGNEFEIDVYLFMQHNKALESDLLDQTVNYQDVYDIVLERMQLRVNLLEHLCHEIGQKLLDKYDSVEKVCVKVSKLKPLYMEKCKKATVELTMFGKKIGLNKY